MGAGSRRASSRGIVATFAACALASIAASTGACTALDGLAGGGGDLPVTADDGGPRPNPCQKNLDEDHDNCGACGVTCGAVEHCLAAKCAPGCPDHTIFVSADGSDNASGCTTKTPKRTIGAAMAFLKTVSAQKHEVHVCRGTYAEAVVLDYPTSILGGYECSTWQRSPSYGGPTFDGINESVVTGSTSASPLTVATVQNVKVDGLTLRAQDTTTMRVPAVTAHRGARATLSNSKVSGSAGSVMSSPASVGVMIEDGAFLDIAGSNVRGGNATNTTPGGYGSAGIFISSTGGGVSAVDTQVTGGGGVVSGGTGSVGVLALGGSAASSFERCSIDGGTGKTGVGSASYGIGLFGDSADVTIKSSTVNGGNGICEASCSTTGVAVSTKGKITLLANRIHGGEAKSAGLDPISFAGVRLSDYASADVQNNFVFAGNTKKAFAATPTAFELRGGGTALVAQNSLAVGPSATGKGTVVRASTKSGTFANNLLLAAGDAPGVPLDLDACQGRTYVFQSNRLVGFPSALPALMDLSRTTGTTCSAGTASTTVDGVETDMKAVFGADNVRDNARIAESCGTDTKCIAAAQCTEADPCMAAIFTAWDPGTAGGLFANGWKLAPSGLACALSKGGTSAVTGLATLDAFGTMRMAPRAIGAHESEASCP